MKFKDFYSHLFTEASLTGKSRSGGTSNWDYYVVQRFDRSKDYFAEKNNSLYGDNIEEKIEDVKEGDKLNIVEKDLKTSGRSKYAKVKHVKSGKEGYLNINSIRKPTSSGKGVIPGGTNSKEFTPDKLKLEGIKFTSKGQIVNTVVSAIKSKYGDDKYSDVRRYLYACMEKAGRTSINESFTKTFKVNSGVELNNKDIKILSKNFGEVLAAIYIIATNKKSKYVEFPKDISQGLYDFISVRKSDITEYYSVKSHGGSSTSMENLNYILKNFSDNNVLFTKHKKEVDVIMSLMNNKEAGKTTLTNIENFFDDVLPSKGKKITDELGKISSYRPKDVSQSELTKWFQGMLEQSDEDTFVDTMNTIYDKVFGDVSRTPQTTDKVLRDIYQTGSGEKYDHGYLYYPMGSYITSYMNENGEYKKILNVILNYGSLINQFNVNMRPAEFEIQIKKFKTESFRFSYNGGSKYPANRPIGFKKG